MRQEVDACAAAAATLARACEPGAALSLWMQRLVDFLMTKRGLSAALHSCNPAYASLPDYFLERLTPALRSPLDSAPAASVMRGDVGAAALRLASARLAAPMSNGDATQARRTMALIVNGLRCGALVRQAPASKTR